MNLNHDVMRRYRRERARGLGARTALQAARYEVAEPATYDFLAELGDYGTDRAGGQVGAFDVTVTVVSDEDSRLGEDDVTGWFTDEYEDGCVRNTRSGWNGQGLKWYRPSNYALEHYYDDERRRGVSKSVARDWVREQIQRDMYADANRTYHGVTVTVSVAGRELGHASLWGIDETPDDDAGPYLREVAADLIGEALDMAREAIPAELAEVDSEAAALRAARQDEEPA